MGSGTDRRCDLNDLNDLPSITPRSGIVMMLAASLLVTANDALVKLALGAAGSVEALGGCSSCWPCSSMPPSADGLAVC